MSKNPRSKPTKFTPPVRAKIIKYAREGQLLKTACLLVGSSYGSFCQVMSEGRDPKNIWQYQFRSAIKAARAAAEADAIRSITIASRDPRHWKAATWFLEHSIQGPWRAMAKEDKDVRITLADVASKLDEADADDE